MNRRKFLQLASLVAAGATVQACAPLAQRLPNAPRSDVAYPLPSRHFAALNRLTYGARPEERLFVAENGLAAWIEDQLDYEGVGNISAEIRLRPYDAPFLNADELEMWERTDAILQFKQVVLLRRVYSRRQLYEQMVEFWTDHFNISVAKEQVWLLKGVDDREVIRPNALGNFHDLLVASAQSPAMLVYLDNYANHKDAPNENYARELLELHTLGVDGGYTQQDVMELARCLTGWTMKQHWWPYTFTFDETTHDDGTKVVLGETIEPNGQAEALHIIDRLAHDERTAHFIATKLVRRFICDDPLTDAPDLVTLTANSFHQSKGNIRATLRTLLLDGLVPMADRLPSKFKRPSQFVASALRQTNAETTAPRPLHNVLRNLGQPDFEWPTPDGPPDVTSAWMNNLLPRWKLALAIARNQIDGVTVDLNDDLDQLALRLLGAPYPPLNATRDALTGVAEVTQRQIMLAGLIASPAFQWK